MPLIRRARGVVLRLVRRRVLCVVVGLALLLPAAWVQVRGQSDAWWAEGSSLIAVATGVALVWTGVFGLRPDWRD